MARLHPDRREPIQHTAGVRNTDPDTSRGAWGWLFRHPDDLARCERAVYDQIRLSGRRGATIDEISARVPWQKVTVATRIAPLRRYGLVSYSGLRRIAEAGKPQGGLGHPGTQGPVRPFDASGAREKAEAHAGPGPGAVVGPS
jgi:hypothetical protein